MFFVLFKNKSEKKNIRKNKNKFSFFLTKKSLLFVE